MSEPERRLVDASNQILGRLASKIAKLLLEGRKVDVINVEKAVISGKKQMRFAKFQEYLDKGSLINPKYGPRHFRKPDLMFKSVVRGMLPRRKKKGIEALSRMRAYIGHPPFVKGNPMKFEDSDASHLSIYYMSLGELASRFSRWKEKEVKA